MRNQLVQRVRRIEVVYPSADARWYDYADAFGIWLSEPDSYSFETWDHTGLEVTSGVVERR